tara:strand:- start:121 stop:345 length:225 start_codon:yes stop_codon:yes gene_type:complete
VSCTVVKCTSESTEWKRRFSSELSKEEEEEEDEEEEEEEEEWCRYDSSMLEQSLLFLFTYDSINSPSALPSSAS